MDLTQIKASLPFLSDSKYEVGKYFRIETANDIWKKQYKERVFCGIQEINTLLVKPMDAVYDLNVKHVAKITGQYGKVACSTPGCKFEVWYKPTNTDKE